MIKSPTIPCILWTRDLPLESQLTQEVHQNLTVVSRSVSAYLRRDSSPRICESTVVSSDSLRDFFIDSRNSSVSFSCEQNSFKNIKNINRYKTKLKVIILKEINSPSWLWAGKGASRPSAWLCAPGPRSRQRWYQTSGRRCRPMPAPVDKQTILYDPADSPKRWLTRWNERE